MKTYLSEIFSSVQGEGPYVGERQLFIRFCGCHRDCLFCDTNTERTETVTVEHEAGSGRFEQIPNPLDVGQLLELIGTVDQKKDNRQISLTGGAPLLQAHFLVELLPRLREAGHRIYLESAGDLPDQLAQVIQWVDVVAMDVKLESVTKEKSTFAAHWTFLKTCREAGVEVFTKLVLSAEADEDELAEAVKGIKEAGGADTLVILQPMTKAARTDAVPSGAQMLRWQQLVARELPNVRVIPQTHKMLEVL